MLADRQTDTHRDTQTDIQTDELIAIFRSPIYRAGVITELLVNRQ